MKLKDKLAIEYADKVWLNGIALKQAFIAGMEKMRELVKRERQPLTTDWIEFPISALDLIGEDEVEEEVSGTV